MVRNIYISIFYIYSIYFVSTELKRQIITVNALTSRSSFRAFVKPI